VSKSRAGNTDLDPRADHFLPRQARLSKPADFKRVFDKPTVSADRAFKVLARSNDLERPRLGMAVSRQVDKRAVGRNRIKRVIRESFRQYFANTGPAMDFVVLPRRESATICNRQLRHSLDKHWVRVLARVGDAAGQQRSGAHTPGTQPCRVPDRQGETDG
jgi:ribonuclease P protein component